MKVKKHFRTSPAVIDFIISDLNFNRVLDKNDCFNKCVINRVRKLNDNYDNKLDKILSVIILNSSYDIPVSNLSRIIYSISKITNALSKGIASLLG